MPIVYSRGLGDAYTVPTFGPPAVAYTGPWADGQDPGGTKIETAKSVITIGPTTVKRAKTSAAKKAVAKVLPVKVDASGKPTIWGLPPWVAYLLCGLGVAGAGVLAMRALKPTKRRNPRRRRREPSSSDPDVQRAIDFRREFHWGIPAKHVKRRKLSPTPRALTEIGEVASITYKTHKRGEAARFFEHEFEGRRPRIGVDPRNKRLHLYGGDYTVTRDGITG